MTISFAEYLNDYCGNDVSKITEIIKEKNEKKAAIIKAAFDDQFVTKETALYKIENEFIDEKITPKNIDRNFLIENLEDIKSTIEDMAESEIRIIVNEYPKGMLPDATPTVDNIEMEGKKRRGRPPMKKEPEDKDVKGPEKINEIGAQSYIGKKVKSAGKWYSVANEQDENAKYLYALDEEGNERLLRLCNIEEVDECIKEEKNKDIKETVDESKKSSKKKQKKDDEKVSDDEIDDLLKAGDKGIISLSDDDKDEDEKDDDDKDIDDDDIEDEDKDDDKPSKKSTEDDDTTETDEEDTTEALKWSDIKFEEIVEDDDPSDENDKDDEGGLEVIDINVDDKEKSDDDDDEDDKESDDDEKDSDKKEEDEDEVKEESDEVKFEKYLEEKKKNVKKEDDKKVDEKKDKKDKKDCK